MRYFTTVVLLFLVVVGGCSAGRDSSTPAGAGRGPEEPTETAAPVEQAATHEMLGLTIPEGFSVSLFASEMRSPRFMALSPDNRVFVADMAAGEVLVLPDADGNGQADGKVIYLSGLQNPHSIAFHEGHIYVAEEHRVTRYKYEAGTDSAPLGEVIIDNLPSSGHFTKTVAFGPDGKLYLSVGSSCNVCVESDPQRAAITQYNPDGSGKEVFATGLRNSVGLAFKPDTGELYAAENGRDWLGDDNPPEEINLITKGGFYGWPYAHGDKEPDPQFGKDKEKLESSISPVVKIQAHSAPLGIAFYVGEQFPEDYRGNLFVALHGSWNREQPAGYKVVRIPFIDGKPGEPVDFITGFLKEEVKIGRPVGILVGSAGEMYISDDYAGKIYRLSYSKSETS